MPKSHIIFASRFNDSVKRRVRSFEVPNTVACRELIKFFYLQGFLFDAAPSYSAASTKGIIVYPNHAAISFTIKPVPSHHQKRALSYVEMRKNSSAGRVYVCKHKKTYSFVNVWITSQIVTPVFRLSFVS